MSCNKNSIKIFINFQFCIYDEFINYVEYIETHETKFHKSRRIVQINKSIQKTNLSSKLSLNQNASKLLTPRARIPTSIPTKQITSKSINFQSNNHQLSAIQSKPKAPQSVILKPNSSQPSFPSLKEKPKINYPKMWKNLLNKRCQFLLQQAENDPFAQFEVGSYIIEGKENFPKSTEVGIMLLQKSIQEGCIDAAIYYSRMLIEGNIISRDLSEASKILKKYSSDSNSTVILLYGMIKKKSKDYQKAHYYIKESAKLGNSEAMFEYGKLLYRGKGCDQDIKEAMKHFELAKKMDVTKPIVLLRMKIPMMR
ncbi:hypothetical protein M9Y10_030003 [Tritrichomonas musculus]|uniref:Uncharacterized protein n=1 Tax=Tritrichomonas musculus TaxID=1915356 RepID=A0ABR2KNP7_9EUKA